MPILDREPDIFPADLFTRFPGETAGSAEANLDDAGSWWAVYTRSRQEKELMRKLRAMEISFYSPLVPHRSRSPQGRIRTSYLPLFSNYVFLYGDVEARTRALTTNTISRTIEVENPAVLVRDLRQIHDLIARGSPVTPEAKLQPGAPVRIRSGSMKGIEGTVIQRHGEMHLIVVVNFLQQGASVKLQDFEVESLG